MNFFRSSDPRVIMQGQDRIDLYRHTFAKRTSGFELPNVKYLGLFTKLENTKSVGDFFVSIPIKNQEEIIVNVLATLLQNVKNQISIGLLFDNCSDHSLEVALQYLEQNFNSYPNLLSVHFLNSEGELFESTSENILFLFCDQTYFVSLQSDIYFTDTSFLDRAVIAFSSIPELFAISGKALVTFRVLSKFKKILNRIFHSYNFMFQFSGQRKSSRRLGLYFSFLGYYGDLSQPPRSVMRYSLKQLNRIYFGEAVIRGPIVWLSDIFKKLNGFDDVGFTLGRDDCDLSLRGRLAGYCVGYIPCTAYSIYEQGTTRKQRSIQDQVELEKRHQLSAKYPGMLFNLWGNSEKLSKVEAQTTRENSKKINCNYGKSKVLVEAS